MRLTPFRVWTGITILGINALVTGCRTTMSSKPSAFGGRVLAPYVSADADLVDLAQKTGTKTFTLAFVVDDGKGRPAWTFGHEAVETDTKIVRSIAALRAIGGDAIISFGGWDERIEGFGIEPGVFPRPAPELAAAYQAVIDKYHVTALDFDVEGPALPLRERNHVRNEALALLQRANPQLHLSYTLPVFTHGMDDDAVALLQDAKAQGVRVAIVNVMTMDFYYNGEKAADPYAMGKNSIAAANATLRQLDAIGLDAKVGICPEIGQNDPSSQPEVFTLADAAEVVTYAAGNPRIGRLDFWSVDRDLPCAPGEQTVGNSHCSGVEQKPYDFSHRFAAFATP
jgi:hypothetical protein